MHMLGVRSDRPVPADTERLDIAAGHLRAVAKALGLTPPQVCDRLGIHGVARRRVMPVDPQSQWRFRLKPTERALARQHVYRGALARLAVHHDDPERAAIEAKWKRIKRRKERVRDGSLSYNSDGKLISTKTLIATLDRSKPVDP